MRLASKKAEVLQMRTIQPDALRVLRVRSGFSRSHDGVGRAGREGGCVPFSFNGLFGAAGEAVDGALFVAC